MFFSKLDMMEGRHTTYVVSDRNLSLCMNVILYSNRVDSTTEENCEQVCSGIIVSGHYFSVYMLLIPITILEILNQVKASLFLSKPDAFIA